MNNYFAIQNILKQNNLIIKIDGDKNMSRIAFVFPGQGAQYVGMGKDFYEQIPVSRKVIDTASEVTGIDIPSICFEENENIHITEYTQIAMLAVEAAMLRALEEKGVRSQVNAGLSLGEYGALIASGVMSERDAFTAVRKRGILMQEAVPEEELWLRLWEQMQLSLKKSVRKHRELFLLPITTAQDRLSLQEKKKRWTEQERR